jgi:uncharacterized protein YdaU (DUF1376 family)
MKRHWMPLYIGDYLGDTGHLTTTQHGAYFLLMMHYWRKGELPDDDKQLSKITKLPLKVWTEYRGTIQDFFYDGWKHKRIDEELQKMMTIREKRALAGQKGGFWSAIAAQKRKGNGSLSNRVYAQANAVQMDNDAPAIVNHTHAHKNITTAVSVEREAERNGSGLSELASIVRQKGWAK